MASFDVESLFTNIPLQETIDLCVDLLFNDKPNINGFTKTDFHELHTITLSESLILSHLIQAAQNRMQSKQTQKVK